MNTRTTLTTLTLGAALAAPALLTGCGNKYVAPEDSDTGYVYQDTQQVQDSETGDSTVDTADTDTSDTHDTVETARRVTPRATCTPRWMCTRRTSPSAWAQSGQSAPCPPQRMAFAPTP